MRISDWSSDVCSSDLHKADFKALDLEDYGRATGYLPGQLRRLDGGGRLSDRAGTRLCAVARTVRGALARTARRDASPARPAGAASLRSEARPLGQECVRTCKSRGPPSHKTKNN